VTTTEEKVRENRARRAADRQGLRLKRSGRRDPRALDFGTYWLLDATRRDAPVVVGGRWGVSLDEIEAALGEWRRDG